MPLIGKNQKPSGFLSAAALKAIACVFMLLDHAGMILFPHLPILRYLGRLAFPMFAFFMAEGCRYSKQPLKRFLLVFAFGFAYLAFYYFYAGQLYPSVFLTFSASIAFCSLCDWLKDFTLSRPHGTPWRLFVSLAAFALALLGAWELFLYVPFDYGFFGMLAPVLAHLFFFQKHLANRVPAFIRAFDVLPVRLLLLAMGLILLAPTSPLGDMQWFALAALPVLALYDGTPGPKKFKYAFYVFYPLHLVALEGIYMLLLMLSYL